MKYLIVDDSKMGRKMVHKALLAYVEDEGNNIFQAQNGQIAVDLYKEHKPDLCFMDLTMPIMDGYEATYQITQYDPDAMVMVVSADVQQGALDKARQQGAIGFIHKPIDKVKMEEILTKVGHI